MGWLRLVGSLNLQVSFAKEPYKRDYILQKRPANLRSLLSVAAPYIFVNDSNSHGSSFGSTSPTNKFASLTNSKVLGVSLAQAASTTVLVVTESGEGYLTEIGNSGLHHES